ncbi:Hsp70 family protein [Patescibacteria group bacterium]|nr:Hsp70 family protein [Patescibacteria group bacterium]MBU1868641.1 Hsp70 family protein [Patescibacteria group bacterium]
MHYGLDFGTTNSVIAVKKENSDRVEVIPADPFGNDKDRILRSLLYIRKKNQEKFVGSLAINNYLKDSRNRKPARFKVFDTGQKATIPIPNPHGGFFYYETDITYREDINKPGQLIQALKTSLREGFNQQVNLFGEIFSLEELIATILGEMKHTADQHLGKDIKEVILGRPVHYGNNTDDLDIQNRMEHAAELAGFKIINFIPEPVGAAYDYLKTQTPLSDKTILVFDFGGGTLDFCLIQQENATVNIVATDGLSIGGDLFNELIMFGKVSPYFGTEITFGPKSLTMPSGLKHSLRKWYEIQALKSPELRNFLVEIKHQSKNPELINNLISLIDHDLGFELFEAIEKAKVTLSQNKETSISFHRHDINLEIPLTRKEFEELIRPQIEAIEKTIKALLGNSKIDPNNINTVICTGGTSYTPIVQRRLAALFPTSNIIYHNVFEGIAAGLARIVLEQ